MTREKSLEITAHIANVISQYAPHISYTQKDVKEARATYSDEKLAQLARDCFYFGDFELFYIMRRF